MNSNFQKFQMVLNFETTFSSSDVESLRLSMQHPRRNTRSGQLCSFYSLSYRLPKDFHVSALGTTAAPLHFFMSGPEK